MYHGRIDLGMQARSLVTGYQPSSSRVELGVDSALLLTLVRKLECARTWSFCYTVLFCKRFQLWLSVICFYKPEASAQL